ncbi:MAG: hypothetical protein ACKVJU_19935 [Verrucomicrobiales bacterium]
MSKWDEFEPYEGEERATLPKWIERIIVPLFMLVALAIVGAIGWFIAIMVYTRYLSRTGNLPSDESMDWIYSAGTVGASIAIAATISWPFWAKREL